jgi:A/G-specific adenine glycosylase
MEARKIAVFRQTVREFYRQHARHDLPWRLSELDGSFDPYKILVSEVMLQQTQVSRVVPKYASFLKTFPTIQALTAAPLGDVLAAWNGLGYNRRASFLWRAAQMIVDDWSGSFPTSVQELQKLPGVGANTAGAVAAYSFNLPEVFIETNIRTVFIHHFFKDQVDIPDAEIRQLVTETIDKQNPREWYWALMDYGAFLKQTVGNLNRSSKSYAKQSKFVGSARQLRGAVIRELLDEPRTKAELAAALPDERLETVLANLSREGLIRQTGERFSVG